MAGFGVITEGVSHSLEGLCKAPLSLALAHGRVGYSSLWAESPSICFRASMRIVDAMESDAQLAYLSEGYSMIRAISAALFELAPGTWRASRARKEVSDESKRRKPPPG